MRERRGVHHRTHAILKGVIMYRALEIDHIYASFFFDWLHWEIGFGFRWGPYLSLYLGPVTISGGWRYRRDDV